MNSRKSMADGRHRVAAVPAGTPVLLVGACVSAALFSVSEPAQGQGPGGSMLESIVVTAQRREQEIQDVPVSISAFSAQDIEGRGARVSVTWQRSRRTSISPTTTPA